MQQTAVKHAFPILLFVFIASMACLHAGAQNKPALKGSVQRIKVHGRGLEGNLEGSSPDRDVSVYLPPGYKTNTQKRYPVVYLLHGYTDSDAKWYGFEEHWINLPRIVDSVFATGSAKEMIFVTPNAYTRYQGSMYANSVTTGNWEDFVAKELVAYIDAHYRTIPQAGSRGLAGHSMGGYGSMRIGQQHPEIFSSVYLLSPCCLEPFINQPLDSARLSAIESVKTIADFEKADFITRIIYAMGAAWSPNPTKPPLFLDLPFENGQLKPMVQAKWWSNMPLVTLDQHLLHLKQLKGFAFDAGDKDEGIAIAIKKLDSTLNIYGLKHDFEVYEGDHLNRIGERIAQKMLPFFSERLSVTTTIATQKPRK
jgi:enterochelin esterase-like enzyme